MPARAFTSLNSEPPWLVKVVAESSLFHSFLVEFGSGRFDRLSMDFCPDGPEVAILRIQASHPAGQLEMSHRLDPSSDPRIISLSTDGQAQGDQAYPASLLASPRALEVLRKGRKTNLRIDAQGCLSLQTMLVFGSEHIFIETMVSRV